MTSKILHIFISSPTAPLTDCLPNGDGLLAHRIITELARRGHSIHVATPYAILQAPFSENVTVYQMNRNGAQHRPSKFRYMVWTRRLLRQVHHETKLDVVHELNPVFSLLSLAFAGLRIPVVLGPHSSRWPADAEGKVSAVRGLRNRFFNTVKDMTVREQHRRASAIVLSTPAALNNVASPELHLGRMFILPPGVDAEEFVPGTVPAQGENLTVLFLANVVARKGIFTLLDAFEHVSKLMPLAKLVIAGSGESLRDVKERVAGASYRNRVEFLGNVARSEVANVIGRCSVYCLPSRGEPFGITAIEAMACGKALVVTGAGGLGYTVSDRGGRQVPVGDPIALSRALLELLENPELCQKMGKHNRQQVELHYAWPKVATRLESIYRQVLGQQDPWAQLENAHRLKRKDITEYQFRSLGGPTPAGNWCSETAESGNSEPRMRQKPIRVLHLLNSVTGRGCGIVNAAIDIISGQLKEGLELAVCSHGGEFLPLLEQHGIPHYSLSQPLKPAALFLAAFELRRIIKQFQPDVVHCHMMTGMVLARAIRFGASYGLVAHVHNVHQRSSNLMRLADRVIAVSQAVENDMASRGIPRKKLRVVYNGTIGSLRQPDPNKSEAKQLQQPALVTVSGMNYRKGISELIAAFELVCRQAPDCHLYLVGDGPDRAEFEAQAAQTSVSSQIHFEGFIPDPVRYMKSAHTFVLASRRDSFGLVLTEARECACAIVATNVDGIPEALDNGEAGLLVPPRNVPALADGILALLKSPDKRAALQIRAQQNLNQFRVERVSAQITEIYREVFRQREGNRGVAQAARLDSATAPELNPKKLGSPTPAMNISVIICTLNRPSVLHETVLSILQQECAPREIIIASPSEKHILAETLALPGVRFLPTLTGLCRQRNEALDAVADGTDIVAFLDDDVELSSSYLGEMVRLFKAHPDIIIASGRLLSDGGRGPLISRSAAVSLCRKYSANYDETRPLSFKPTDSGYGCNLICRYAGIGNHRFDERLPLYAFLEDRDFSYSCTLGKHPAVELENAVAVHLGWRSGRVSGVRLGFSTVVNPIYLRRKSNTFSFRFIFVQYWMRCLVGNILGILTRDQEYDRVGLLKGNLIGWWHLLSGKCEPGHILNL